MKRFLVVLTILVLVAGFAFAESKISGKVTAAYTFDFDAKTVDYSVSGTNAKLEWTWNSHTVGPYEGNKPYATVTVALSVNSVIDKDAVSGAPDGWAGWTFDNSYKAVSTNGLAFGKVTIQLKEAKIVGEDWSIDLLKAALYGEYAKSAWDMTYNSDTDAYDKPYTYDNTNGGKRNGITVSVKDFAVGIAVNKAEWLDAEKYEIDLSSQTPEFKFDGGSAQAAAIIGLSKAGDENTKFSFSFSVKGNYAVDGLSASAAFDGRYANEKFNFDTAVKVAYAPATLDFYYASKTSNPANLEKYMSIRVSVDVAKIAENVPVKAFVGMQDILAEEGKSLVVGAEYDGETVSAEASLDYVFDYETYLVGGSAKAKKLISGFGLEGGVEFAKLFGVNIFAGEVGVNYTADKYEASADIAIAKLENVDDAYFGFTASVSTDKLVENAVLKAELNIDSDGAAAAYDFLNGMRNSLDEKAISAFDKAGNNLTISCEIKF